MKIIFSDRVSSEIPASHVVALNYHLRVKGRQRIITNDGLEAGIVIERGDELHHGEKLSDGNGRVLEIVAKPEAVSVAETDSALLFARACYHMGNRHTEVQIEPGKLVYLRDHVLDKMLASLGLTVSEQMLAFSPENGAYSGGHTHSHDDYASHHEH